MTDPIELKTVEVAQPGTCGCGQHDVEEPVLDVRVIPHVIRHASVIGAFDAIPPGGTLVLVAPHNPIPLLNQLSERCGIDVEYLDDAPEAWRLRVTKSLPQAG